MAAKTHSYFVAMGTPNGGGRSGGGVSHGALFQTGAGATCGLAVVDACYTAFEDLNDLWLFTFYECSFQLF